MPSQKVISAGRERWRKEVAAELPKLLDELLASPDRAKGTPRTHGVYLFSEYGKPMYVGRTGLTERARLAGKPGYSNFLTRRRGHTQARHSSGTFAYHLAAAEFRRKGKHLAATREQNCDNEEFKREFRRQCDRVKKMEFQVVEITDDTLAAAFEIYAATVLRTTNSWATS